ncbi:MAG: glycosyl hydrolase family 18 protein, partial [Bacillota bacterium]|nr:glycosyl hydrolase family 18 protein [Bacillota bacterium]
AFTVIPKEKILMGIPNFGADWTMPYKPGDKAKILSNNQALELARKVGSEIQYDIPSQAPYFYYYEPNGKQHVVWFEDARSSKAKQDIVSQYGLGGISYWTVNNPFQQNWLIQSNQFSPIREE